MIPPTTSKNPPRGAPSGESRYADLSFWHSTAGDLTPRAALDGDTSVDVAIVGGGLTGLWTAWYLLERTPSLRIGVLEKEIAGFGASGRNGGWCSALFPRSTGSLEQLHGREAAVAMRRAMIDSIDEVGRQIAAAGIQADFVRGGSLAYARSGVQQRTALAEVAQAEAYGVDDLEWRSADEVGAAGAVGAVVDRNCASLHPAKLVRGLAAALESRGVRVFEQSEVTEVATGKVTTARGVVEAEHVVLATEGYTATFPATRRRILPLYALMIATEPLPASFWAATKIERGQTFTDYRHLIVFGQRTADDRIAFGGRGARYHWGSAIRPEYDRVPRVFEHLRRALVELFPAAADAAITHSWGGPAGVPRDWHASVAFDPTTRIARAGGYVGDGLSTTNLAGRTLADLLTGRESELTRLPWVGHESPNWEPEPLRFVGATLGMLGISLADAEERLTRRSSLIARLMGPLVGY